MKIIDNTPIENFSVDWGDPDGTGTKAKSLKQVQAFIKNKFLGLDYTYIGIATPSTTPMSITAEDKVFYIAVEAGDYTGFGQNGIKELTIFRSDNGRWVKERLGIPLGIPYIKSYIEGGEGTGTPIVGWVYNLVSATVGTSLSDLPILSGSSYAIYAHIMMPIFGGESVTLTGGGGLAVKAYTFLDKAGKIISIEPTAAEDTYTVTAPTNATHILVQGSASTISANVTYIGIANRIIDIEKNIKNNTADITAMRAEIEEIKNNTTGKVPLETEIFGINRYDGENLADGNYARARAVDFVQGGQTIECLEGYRIYGIFEYDNAGTYKNIYTLYNTAETLLTSVTLEVKDDTKYRISFSKMDMITLFTEEEAQNVAVVLKDEEPVEDLENYCFGNATELSITATNSYYNLKDDVAVVGEYNINDATPVTLEGFSYILADVQEGLMVTLSGGGAEAARGYSFYDSTGLLIEKSDSSSFSKVQIIAPTGAAKVLIQGRAYIIYGAIERFPDALVYKLPKIEQKANLALGFNCYYCDRTDTVTGTNNNNYSNLISKYDALMADFPTMIERNALGSSVNGQTLYEYVFRPLYYNAGDPLETEIFGIDLYTGNNLADDTSARARTVSFVKGGQAIKCLEGYRIYGIFEYDDNGVYKNIYTLYSTAETLLTSVTLEDKDDTKYRISFSKMDMTTEFTEEEAQDVAVEMLYRSPDAVIIKKKVLITVGVHGDEQAAINGLFFMLDDYVRGNSTQLDFLNNLVIHVIPCVNPDGYNANTRLNAKAVNINRNFEEGWVDTDESGDAPADQPETKIVQDWIDNNNDAVIAIDFHNSGIPREVGYIGSSSSNKNNTDLIKIKKAFLEINNDSISMWKSLHGMLPSPTRNYVWGYTGEMYSNGLCGAYMASEITTSFTYETTIAVIDNIWNSIPACNVSAESFSNLMKAVNKVLGGI